MVGVLPRAGFLRSVQRNGGGVQLTGSRVHDDSKFDRGQRETFGRRLLGPQVGDRFALRAPLGIRSAHFWRNRHRKFDPGCANDADTCPHCHQSHSGEPNRYKRFPDGSTSQRRQGTGFQCALQSE